MPCCRCRTGTCSACVCAKLRRCCANCATSSCGNNEVVKQCEAAPQPKSSADPFCGSLNLSNEKSSKKTTSSTDSEESVVPRHWIMYAGCMELAIRDMHMFHRPCLVSVRDSNLWYLACCLVQKTWFDESQWRMSIIDVRQVENPVLYQRYLARRKEIRLSTGCGLHPITPVSIMAGQKDFFTHTLGLQLGYLETSVNECVLLHGTTADAVNAIAQNGMDLRLANPSGRYGSGIYFAESSLKSNMYTDFPRGVKHKLHAFIVRASLGRPFVSNVPHTFRRPPCAEPGCRSMDSCNAHRRFYDSVIGTNIIDQRTHREFIVYDPAQCLPELVVTYSLSPSNGTAHEFK